MTQSSSADKQRLTRRQLSALNEVLTQVLSFEHPADQVISRYFRAHRQLGGGDRRMIAETVYAGLRHYYRVEAMLAGDDDQRYFALASLIAARGYSISQLEPVLNGSEIRWAKNAKSRPKRDDLCARAELPEWVIKRLQAVQDDEAIVALGRSLQSPAPLDLRVNRLKSDRAAVLAQLQAEGIAATPCRWAPDGIRLEDKPALQRHPLFLDGVVEVQDEGSQLISLLVDPQPGERVVDFCAGAGGKTLHLGALMDNRGRIDAYDIAERRLQRLKPRLARSGLSNIQTRVLRDEHDPMLKKRAAGADRVLVDAPCTGLGTLRRNPDLKFRQSEAGLMELTERQASILAAASRLVKPGGRLIYATCSLLPDENQQIIADFLRQQPEFTRLSVAARLAEFATDLTMADDLVLSPQDHDCDGFYACVMQRSVADA
ncbi:MAG: RsmB/NOP family class I SAM-dependent RNA methyltransferase [Wenzhouxiangellaceae bacterium]